MSEESSNQSPNNSFILVPKIAIITISGIALATLSQLAPLPVFNALKPYHLSLIATFYILAIILVTVGKKWLLSISTIKSAIISVLCGVLIFTCTIGYIRQANNEATYICSFWKEAYYRITMPPQFNEDGSPRAYIKYISQRNAETLAELVDNCSGLQGEKFIFKNAEIRELKSEEKLLALHAGVVFPLFILLAFLGVRNRHKK